MSDEIYPVINRVITNELTQKLINFLAEYPAKQVFDLLVELTNLPVVELTNPIPKLVEATLKEEA